MVDYAASKHAALAFHEGLAAELATRYRARKVRPVVVNQGYINAITREWKSPMETLFRDVNATLIKHVKKLITQQFSQYPLLQSRVTYVFLSSRRPGIIHLPKHSLHPADQSRPSSS